MASSPLIVVVTLQPYPSKEGVMFVKVYSLLLEPSPLPGAVIMLVAPSFLVHSDPSGTVVLFVISLPSVVSFFTLRSAGFIAALTYVLPKTGCHFGSYRISPLLLPLVLISGLPSESV